MALLSVSNVLQLTSHLISGICVLREELFDYPVMLKTLGANLDGSFLVYAVFTAVLAFERFLLVASPSLMRRLFSLTAMRAWFLLALNIWLTVFALLSTPLLTLSFNREQFFWRYSYSSNNMDFYQSVTEAAVLVPFVTAALLHVAIAAIITYQKHVKGLLLTQSYVERRILIQAAVIAAYDVGTTAMWALDVLPASTLSTVLLDLMWVVSGGVNPVVYFSLN
ncbi:CRE-SRT-61 protein, partial [Aphelenchoides avenae]